MGQPAGLLLLALHGLDGLHQLLARRLLRDPSHPRSTRLVEGARKLGRQLLEHHGRLLHQLLLGRQLGDGNDASLVKNLALEEAANNVVVLLRRGE